MFGDRVVTRDRRVPFLREFVEDRRHPARSRLAAARMLLGEAGEGELPRIARIIRSAREDTVCRVGLVQLLEARGFRRAVPILVPALRSRDIHVCMAAELSLRRLASLPGERGEALAAAARRGLIFSIRNSRFPWRFRRQLRILIEVSRERPEAARDAAGLLMEVIRTQHPDTGYGEDVLAMALEGLVELSPDLALSALMRTLHSDSDLVRYKSVQILGRLGGRGFIPELGRLAARDLIGRIREAALQSAFMIRIRNPLPVRCLP